MGNAKKNLKFMSDLILIFLTCSFIRTILEVFMTDIKVNNISAEFMIVAKIILCLIYVVIFLPQIYVGVKGIKMSKNPDSSKAHIIWAVIFVAFAVFSAVSAVANMINNKDMTGNIFRLIDAVIDFVLYFFYVKYAKQVLVA